MAEETKDQKEEIDSGENTPELSGMNRPKINEKGQYLPGVSGNPNGRPKGLSIKDRVRQWLEEHPDDMNAFVEHFVKTNRDLAWQMMEGRPSQGIGQADDLDKLVINVTTYANSDTLPVSSTPVPVGTLASSSEIQDSGTAQTSGEVENSIESTSTENSA